MCVDGLRYATPQALILACDGIWDVMSNEECAAFVVQLLATTGETTVRPPRENARRVVARHSACCPSPPHGRDDAVWIPRRRPYVYGPRRGVVVTGVR